MRKAVEDEARKLSLAFGGAITSQVQAEISLMEWGTELQELRLATSAKSDHLSPLLRTMVPLVDQLQTCRRCPYMWSAWSLKVHTMRAACTSRKELIACGTHKLSLAVSVIARQ